MIYNMWYGVISSKEIKKGKPYFAKRMNKNLVFWRDSNGEVACIDDMCCHRRASLSKGRIIGGDIACPFHSFIYNRDGKVVSIPANGKTAEVEEKFYVESYIVKEEHGFIWFWYGDKNKVTSNIPFPENLKDKKFSYICIKDSWHNHYSRCIENQLDVVHIPFVHYNTIGRGNKTVVNGPLVELKDNVMKFYTNNVKDEGQKAIPFNELKKENLKYFLYFYYPNTWQNYIADDIRILGVFAPVDDLNTVVYMIYYQKSVSIPVIRNIFNFFGAVFSRVILSQDKNVVKTEPPEATYLKMGEKLIRGDAPIIMYRKHREYLKNHK